MRGIDGGPALPFPASMENVIMVGDGKDDMKSGLAAGCATCLLAQTERSAQNIDLAHYVADSLTDVVRAIAEGRA